MAYNVVFLNRDFQRHIS